jgi:hypothetical protein
MMYFDFLESNKKELIEKLERIFTLYNVEPVGNGYIDCIVMKDKLKEFINEITALGILITDVSWWCYVNPANHESTGCPHGMGGPKSEYYEGWFSELQNDFYEVDKDRVDSNMNFYDKQSVYSTNMQTIEGVQKMLKEPFRYTPTDYIQGNKCVTPGIWLLVPDTWKRC